MSTWTILLVSVISVTAKDDSDAETLLRRVIEAQERQHELTQRYAFLESTLTRHLDEEGRTRETNSETFLVTPGGPEGEYRRLVEKDGAPLPPSDEAKEEKKFREYLKETMELPPEELESKSREKAERRIKRYRERLEEAIEVYDFEPLPDEVVDGQRLRVFHFSPTPGYEGRSRSTKILACMEGEVWIDPERDQLAKLSLRVREELKLLAGIFGRVSEGSQATAKGFFNGEDLWLLDRIDLSLDARLYFLKNYRQQIVIDYHDYRKYSVETDERLGLLERKSPP